jgi:hypothetical protein
VIALGSAVQMVAFSVQASAPPFPVFAMAYAINGFGESLEDAQANGFVANYKDNAATKMGILHAAYGKYTYPSPSCRWFTLLRGSSRCRGFDSTPRCDTVFPAS